MLRNHSFQITKYFILQLLIYLFLGITAVVCIVPMLHILAVSLSSPMAAQSGVVMLLPVEFTAGAYKFVIENLAFWRSLSITFERILLGGSLSIILTVLAAYPLSRDPSVFPQRKWYVWYLYITILISGGLIPTYMVVRYTGLLDTIWSLVIPSAVSVWNIILMLNFFRQLPKELDDAAYIDGANHWTNLWKIYIPLSTPSIATILLFTIVGQWNAWFDAILYISKPANYPLQTYLQNMIISGDVIQMMQGDEEFMKALQYMTPETLVAAQIFVGALPILMVYPFLQKHFAKGITLGSVKG